MTMYVVATFFFQTLPRNHILQVLFRSMAFSPCPSVLRWRGMALRSRLMEFAQGVSLCVIFGDCFGTGVLWFKRIPSMKLTAARTWKWMVGRRSSFPGMGWLLGDGAMLLVSRRISFFSQLSNEKDLGWLGYIGNYTTQLYRDYNKPL